MHRSACVDIDLDGHEDHEWCFTCRVCDCMCWCERDEAVPVDEALMNTHARVTVNQARFHEAKWPWFAGSIFSQVACAQDKSPGDCGVTGWSEVLRAFGRCCAYCNKKLEYPELEHVIATSNGGKTNKNNVVPACLKCNRSKCARDVFSWLGPDRADEFVARCVAATAEHSSGLAPGKVNHDREGKT